MYKLADHVACAVAGITGDLSPSLKRVLKRCKPSTSATMVLQGNLHVRQHQGHLILSGAGMCAQLTPTSS